MLPAPTPACAPVGPTVSTPSSKLLRLGARAGLLLGALCAGSGCASYVPFTQELRDQHHLDAKQLQNLQFYNSHPIVLRREVDRGNSQVTSGHKLLVIAGKQIEEVVIEEHTPGVVVGVSEMALKVSFEEGSYMEFSLRDAGYAEPVMVTSGRFAEPPNPFPGDHSRESAPRPRQLEGSGNFWLLPHGGSSVSFQGQTWQVMGQTQQSHLVISTESLESVEEETTVLKGRKL